MGRTINPEVKAATTEYKELNALISLLDDPDNRIFEKISEKIYSYGADVIPILETAWENAFDHLFQQRISTIISKLRLDNLYVELYQWAHTGHRDLFKGFYLISNHHHPDLDQEKILKQILQIKQDIWLELNDNLTSLEKVKVMNHIIFDIYRFAGDKGHAVNPQCLHLDTLLELKKGTSLTLGILYIIIAQYLKIPVLGVNLPEHFILAYANELVEGSNRYIDEHDVLFYINPFNKGAVFTKKEIDQFIKLLHQKPDKSFYNPCDHISIIKRLISELKQVYETGKNGDKARELTTLGRALI
jgi:regulator of sirC expression with transglutaminase-like and TPR domain